MSPARKYPHPRTLEQLDSLVRAGEAMDRALGELDRTHLRALADRLEIPSERDSANLQTSIRRRLIGLRRAQ